MTAAALHTTPISPNQVTLLSAAGVALASAMYIVLPAGMVAVICVFVALQTSYVLDCVDGQLARARGQTSPFGGWLDITLDAFFGAVLTFSILVWMVASNLDHLLPVAAGMCALTAGRTISIYSVKINSLSGVREASGGPEGSGEIPRTSPLRWFLVLLMDTPVLYACLAVLRDFPHALAVYGLGMGLLYTLTAYRLGLRLRAG